MSHEHKRSGVARVLTFKSHSRAIETCECGFTRTFDHAWNGQPLSPNDDTWTEWRSPTPSADTDS